jgi:hypothetical protein
MLFFRLELHRNSRNTVSEMQISHEDNNAKPRSPHGKEPAHEQANIDTQPAGQQHGSERKLQNQRAVERNSAMLKQQDP